MGLGGEYHCAQIKLDKGLWNQVGRRNASIRPKPFNHFFPDRLVKFNPTNGMLITGMAFDITDSGSSDENLSSTDCWPENTNDVSSLLQRLFHLIGLIMHNIEFADCKIYGYWSAALQLLRCWNQPNVGFVQPIGEFTDFDLSLKVFECRLREVQATVPNYSQHLSRVNPNELNIVFELKHLRHILTLYNHKVKAASCW